MNTTQNSIAKLQQISLKDPFMVIATQNPIESRGANPLPESQMDRFMTYLATVGLEKNDSKNQKNGCRNRIGQ